MDTTSSPAAPCWLRNQGKLGSQSRALEPRVPVDEGRAPVPGSGGPDLASFLVTRSSQTDWYVSQSLGDGHAGGTVTPGDARTVDTPGGDRGRGDGGRH